MAAFNNHGAHDRAVAMVTAALQSGCLKLAGPADGAEIARATSDADYLNYLINSLAANLGRD